MICDDEYEIISTADYTVDDLPKKSRPKNLSLDSASSVLSFNEAIKSVLSSRSFNKEYFKRRKFYLCESYCLLWQHSGTGDLDRVKSSQQLKTGAYAAILLDLFACGKIHITENKDLSHGYCQNTTQLVVQVIDSEPTFTFMDRVVFNKLLQHYERTGGRPRLLEDWLATAQENCCVIATLKNLVSRGILGSSPMSVFGMFHKHPTINIGPVQELERELKAVSLKERKPDSYMLALLTMSLMAENYFTFVDPILEKHFTKKEYRVAKENIKMIVETQGIVLKSPKFTRKKFSIELPHQPSRLAIPQHLSPIPGSPKY